MVITVCGTPGTDHTTVAKLLARRFDIQFISAYSIKSELENKYSDPVELEKAVNNQLEEKLNSGESLVCDSLLGSFLAIDSTSILLTRDLISIMRSAETLYRNKQAEIEMSLRCTGENCFDPSKYRVVVNTTGVDKEMVVETVVSSMHKYEKASWISPKLCVPMQIGNYHRTLEDIEDIAFDIGKCYATYVLQDDYNHFVDHVVANKLVKVKDHNIYPLPSLVLNAFEDYRPWLNLIDANMSLMQMSVMLSKYCARDMLDDVDLAYIQLIKNGNPAKRLFDMGYAL